MTISIQQVVLKQLQMADAERRLAKEERHALRDQHLRELAKKAYLTFQAQNLQVDVNISKSEVGAATAPFGAIGTIAGNLKNIDTDQTEGRRVGVLERGAGLVERDAAAIQHDLEEAKATERARVEEARQSYDAGVEALEKQSEVSKLA